MAASAVMVLAVAVNFNVPAIVPPVFKVTLPPTTFADDKVNAPPITVTPPVRVVTVLGMVKSAAEVKSPVIVVSAVGRSNVPAV